MGLMGRCSQRLCVPVYFAEGTCYLLRNSPSTCCYQSWSTVFGA